MSILSDLILAIAIVVVVVIQLLSILIDYCGVSKDYKNYFVNCHVLAAAICLGYYLPVRIQVY